MLGKITRPNGTTIVTDSVGLLNIYEYQMSYTGTTYSNSYLNNGLSWYTLTPYSPSDINYVSYLGNSTKALISNSYGIRPSINLKSSVKIISGDGTEENPYRLEGDNDSNLSGTLLNTRYSGEYITFGTGENNLYQIVSHETEGLTKITSALLLKENGTFKTMAFGDRVYYSRTNTIGSFFNGEYLNSGTYLTEDQVNMIEDNTTWYLGKVGNGESYKLAKYTDTSMSGYATNTDAKVGLLRLGELMAGQFDKRVNNIVYWIITRYGSTVNNVRYDGVLSTDNISISNGVRPSLNLKSNVIITSGDGTLQNPFNIKLAS